MLRLLIVMAAAWCAGASLYDFIPRDVMPGVGEYFYIGIPLNWTEAVQVCRSCGSHLLVIDSAAEAEATRQMMKKHVVDFIHLGFHDHFIEGKYNTILGQPINKPCSTGTHWARGSPKGGTAHNCGGYSSAGFTDTKCSDKYVFICEVNAHSAHKGPRGYTQIPHFGYYKHHENETTWVVADETCRQEGGHLVVLNSQQEAEALTREFKTFPTNTFHVGVHRFFGGNEDFVTVLGGSLRDAGYMTWVTGYPFDSHLNRPFVFYYIGSRNDAPGLATHNITSSFICEHNTV